MKDLRRAGIIRVDDDFTRTRVLPCALCGLLLDHRRAFPVERARLAFRASVVDGEAWLPIVHSRLVCCDPPPDTAAFWDDDVRRENWKAAQRFGLSGLVDGIVIDPTK